MGYILGTALGTTFVAAACARDSGVEVVRLNGRDELMSAEVYPREDGVLLPGEAASELRVSDSADQGGSSRMPLVSQLVAEGLGATT